MPDPDTGDVATSLAVLTAEVRALGVAVHLGRDATEKAIGDLGGRVMVLEYAREREKAREEARIEAEARLQKETARIAREAALAVRQETTKLLGPGAVKVIGWALSILAAGFGGSQIPH